MCNILRMLCSYFSCIMSAAVKKRPKNKSETSRGFLTECYEMCHMASLSRGLTVLDACSHTGETEGELPQ